jgi:RNA polymerase sigma factor (sigma-70 family)
MGMTAEPLPISDGASDHELVRASLAGDRDAFGRLVERHQAAVCAITYAAAGKLHLGQDLAQETFLEAWRSLGALRDAGQLRAWLCGIARNVAQNALRRRGADTVPERAEETSDERTPEASALANEETRLVWQAMADIPADYREPLILFYWQEQSARRVGETLGLSEDAVKQRLSRGRKLLRREVETLIADGLLRLRPGATFTAAVLAALPLGAREAAAAGAATLAHSTAAKLAGGLGAAGAGGLAGALVGVGGAFIGARASIVNTRSPRERRFMVQMVWVAVALSTVMVALQLVVAFFFRTLFASVAWHVAVGTVETAAILWLVVRTNRRQRQIQVEEGTATPPPPPTAPHEARWTRSGVYQSLGGGIAGSLCWMLPMCAIAGDWATALAVVAAGLVLFHRGTAAVLRAPDRYFEIASRVFAALGGLTLLVVNLRWEAWMVFYRQSSFYQASADLPLWAINLLLVVVVGWTTIAVARRGRGG